jgi:CheY-like chemotaxis protein
MTDSSRGVVLVVEDEPLVRAIIVSELEDAGFDVVEAADGETAMAFLASARPVSLLFTDIRMPGAVDGWRLAEEARKLHPGLPVIYATGFSEEQPRIVPGGRLFRKPYRADAILGVMRELGVRP